MKLTDEFYEERIKWKGTQLGLPNSNTFHWHHASPELKERFVLSAGKPVYISQLDADNLVVICTRGVIVFDFESVLTVLYTDIRDIRNEWRHKMYGKSEAEQIELLLKNNRKIKLETGLGSSRTAVMQIILMMVRAS